MDRLTCQGPLDRAATAETQLHASPRIPNALVGIALLTLACNRSDSQPADHTSDSEAGANADDDGSTSDTDPNTPSDDGESGSSADGDDEVGADDEGTDEGKDESEGDDDDDDDDDDGDDDAGDDESNDGGQDDENGDEDTSAESGCDDPIDPADLFRDAEVELNEWTRTVLMVKWQQSQATDASFVEFRVRGGDWASSPAVERDSGEHIEAVLGVPAETEVELRLVAEVCDSRVELELDPTETGALPSDFPRIDITKHDPNLVAPHPWFLGGTDSGMRYSPPFYIYIIDRDGEVVWYYRDYEYDRILSYPRKTRDGTHLAIDHRQSRGESFVKYLTLDRRYERRLALPDMCDAFDVVEDGLVYNTLEWSGQQLSESRLVHLSDEGDAREIWRCVPWLNSHGLQVERNNCYTNSVNFSPDRRSVLLAFPYLNTVLDIDFETGDILHEWGDLADEWRFEPSSAGFQFQHHAQFTHRDELIVSTHVPGVTPKQHRFSIFEIDGSAKVLREIWSFGEGYPEVSGAKGMADLLPGGNVIANYGSGGLIREITPDGEIAWEVKLTIDGRTTMDEHNFFIDDLYDLNRAPKATAER